MEKREKTSEEMTGFSGGRGGINGMGGFGGGGEKEPPTKERCEEERRQIMRKEEK